MRTLAAIVLLATCFFGGIDCYSQDLLCSARIVGRKPDEKPLPSAEVVHQILLQETTIEKRRTLSLEDVEFILKCGTPQDAAELFAALRNTSIHTSATVVEADQYAIRVVWYDGFKPHLEAFRFNFVTPLPAIPRPGDKVLISGSYSSYSQEPFQINMTNPSFRSLHPQQ